MSNEFSTLFSLLIRRGFSPDNLQTSIQAAITTEFFRRYPRSRKEIQVLLDMSSGEIRILSGKKDITPPNFALDAASLAQALLIQRLGEADVTAPLNPPSITRSVTEPSTPARDTGPNTLQQIFSWLGGFLFWGYNSLFALFFLWYGGYILFTDESRMAFFEALKTTDALTAVLIGIIILFPIATLLLAVNSLLTHRAINYGKLFFFGELPVVALSTLLLSITSSAIPSVVFFLAIFLSSAILAYLAFLLGKSQQYWLQPVQTGTLALVTLASGYLTLLYSFFLPPWIALLFQEVLRTLTRSTRYYEDGGMPNPSYFTSSALSLLLGFLWFIFLTLLLIAPYFLVYFLGRKTIKSATSLQKTSEPIYSYTRLLQAGSGIAILFIAALFAISYQPKFTTIINQLSAYKEAKSFEEKEVLASDLIKEESTIKKVSILVSSKWSYPFVPETMQLAQAYKRHFSFSSGLAQFVETSFIKLAAPFVYSGPELPERLNLSALHRELFADDIVSKYKSYAPPTSYTPVTVTERSIYTSTDATGLFASIAVTEEFSNSNSRQEEVIYDFSLPEGSVVTDLKLGPDLEFSGVIAPTGAASKIYNQELNRRRDPALLVQTGPLQYRLRVFPIPASSDKSTLGGKNQKVQFTYVTPLTPSGYSLPIVHASHRVSQPERIIARHNELPITLNQEDHFVPSRVAGLDSLCDLTPQSTAFQNGSLQVIPFSNLSQQHGLTCDPINGISAISTITNKNIAILLDVSAPQKEHAQHEEIVNLLEQHVYLLERNNIEVFRYNSLISQATKLTPENLASALSPAYFGESTWETPFKNFSAQGYDAVFVLTGGSPAESDPKQTEVSKAASWFIIHPDSLPQYPDVLTYSLLQGGGGTSTSLERALTRFAFTTNSTMVPNLATPTRMIAQTPFWILTTDATATESLTTSPPTTIETTATTQNVATSVPSKNLLSPVELVASAGLILESLRAEEYSVVAQNQILDTLHQKALAAHIVTPTSSLIALVNDQQRADLDQFQDDVDRFNFEVTPPRSSNTFSAPPISQDAMLRAELGSDIAIPNSISIDEGALPTGFSSNRGIASSAIDNIDLLLPALSGFVVISIALIIAGTGVFFFKRHKLQRSQKA